MKISIDAGALCGRINQRFGNYIFSKNLILALSQYDNNHRYFLYSFCQKPNFIIEKKNLVYKKLSPKIFWSTARITFEEIKEKKDYFLALNQAVPFWTPAKIIAFSHGLSFHFYPHLYPHSYRLLETQLDKIINRSKKIIVSSKKVKKELLSIKKINKDKIVVIPYGVPWEMGEESSRFKVQSSKLKERFFLFVGMNHPIKNIYYLVKRFKEFKTSKIGKNYRLVLVSNINDKLGRNIEIVQNISRQQIKKLYQKATALLTASLYESFNLPVLEALSQGCPVIGLKSAIIPELQPYVNLAKNQEEFLFLMKQAVNNNLKIIDRGEIIEQFSWKNYIHQLTKLYL